MDNYIKLGLDIEDNRPYDPMKIDLAIVNCCQKLGIAVPDTKIVNATRTTRKKIPAKKRIIRKVVKKTATPRKRRVNLVTYEEPTEEKIPDNKDREYKKKIVYIDKNNNNNENVEYIEVEDNFSVAVNVVKKK